MFEPAAAKRPPPPRWTVYYRLALAALAVFAVLAAALSVMYFDVPRHEAAIWSAAVTLGGLGFWIGLCRGSWGQSIIGLNAGALLGLGSALLVVADGTLREDMVLLLLAFNLWWIYACAVLGAPMGGLGGGEGPALRRVALGMTGGAFSGMLLALLYLGFAAALLGLLPPSGSGAASFPLAVATALAASAAAVFLVYLWTFVPFRVFVEGTGAGRKDAGEARAKDAGELRAKEKAPAPPTPPGPGP